MTKTNKIERQKSFCSTNNYSFLETIDDQIVGFAIETLGKRPINGLRHNPVGNTSGWYIWCGEEFSSDDDFFSPLHAEHLESKCPEINQLLGLSPGHRFLIDGDHLDIWFDETLLYVDEQN